jgi:MFS family permease
LLTVCFVSAFWGVGYYSSFVWISYFMTILVNTNPNQMEEIPFTWVINFFATIGLIICFPLCGLLGDMFGEKYENHEKGFILVMKMGLISAILLSIPAFLSICTKSELGAVLGQFCFVLSLSLFGSNLPAYMLVRFPASKRYSGIGFSYNIAQAFFSGTAPFIQTKLVLSRSPLSTEIDPEATNVHRHLSASYSSSYHQFKDYFAPLIQQDSRLFPAYYIISVAFLSLMALQFGPYLIKRFETPSALLLKPSAPSIDRNYTPETTYYYEASSSPIQRSNSRNSDL